MTKVMNKNFQNCLDQINNSLDLLNNKRIIDYYNSPEYGLTEEGFQYISWKNHVPGRTNCGKAFTTIEQYLGIIENGAYHGIFFDGSIIRVSYIYDGPLLLHHSLLWWPCPVRFNNEAAEEYGYYKSIKLLLDGNDLQNIIKMRSPIRIDYDRSNDTVSHPKAHLHTQHHETRTNIVEPICFNKFIKFIIINYYPEVAFDFRSWTELTFQHRKSDIRYYNQTRILIS